MDAADSYKIFSRGNTLHIISKTSKEATSNMDKLKIISNKIEYANTTIKQIVGLMFRLHIPKDLIIVYDMKKTQPIFIHTCFCFYNIDAIFLNEEQRVVQVMEDLPPWQFTFEPSKPSRYFIESMAGMIKTHNVKVGDVIKI